jgi:hypothetical protein
MPQGTKTPNLSYDRDLESSKTFFAQKSDPQQQ